jgi:hypothetical protein
VTPLLILLQLLLLLLLLPPPLLLRLVAFSIPSAFLALNESHLTGSTACTEHHRETCVHLTDASVQLETLYIQNRSRYAVRSNGTVRDTKTIDHRRVGFLA